ncbi:hypothetical protein CGI47_04620 [Vibrio parahaemolyticus]|nr:hypothetical protein CGI47_04620 [Vibrio parahaemolyticus]
MFTGETTRASREVATPIVSADCLNQWLSREADRFSSEEFNPKEQIEVAATIRALGGNVGNLMFGTDNHGPINVPRFLDKAKDLDSDIVLVFDAAIDDEDLLSDSFVMKDNVFLSDVGIPETLQ